MHILYVTATASDPADKIYAQKTDRVEIRRANGQRFEIVEDDAEHLTLRLLPSEDGLLALAVIPQASNALKLKGIR